MLTLTSGVSITTNAPDARTIDRGVPQGSVLGPILFLLYTTEVLDIVHSFGLSAHAYADDTQLYFHTHPDDIAALTPRITACVAEIKNWMSSNRLQLNPDKTEFIWFATPYHFQHLPQQQPVPLHFPTGTTPEQPTWRLAD